MAKVADIVDRFLAWCTQQRAKATVKFYRSRLAKFRAAFGQRDWSTLTQIEIEDHLSLIGQGASSSTRHHNVVALNTLQSWGMARDLIDKRAFEKLEKPRPGQRTRIPTEQETEIILAAGSEAFCRIYQALRHCGARPGELCRATIADLKEGGTVIELAEHKTSRKTGKPRRILVGQKMREIVAEAIGDRKSGPIFLSPAGKAWKPENLSRTFRKLRDDHGLQREGSDKLVLYMTRHEFGTKATEKLGIHAAGEMLGHTQITTTQRYAHADENKLRTQQDSVLD